MSKGKRETVRFRRGDYWRAVLSDTTPAELPIVVSNDGFYRNLHKLDKLGSLAKSLVERLVIPAAKGKEFTIPYNFKIVKDEKSARRLSLPHPRSQAEICLFYKNNTALILHYCSTGDLSIRRPTRDAAKYYISNPRENDSSYKSDKVTTLNVELLEKNPASYYSYSGFNRLHQFFNSRHYNTLERKFSTLASFDIARCFDSVYTHSIAWATKSKEEAKETAHSATFGGMFDRLMQSLNYNETNGIVVGPEVSRIFAEIILNKIDSNLVQRLQDLSLIKDIDYSCYRYVDNYYVFCNENSVLEKIKSELQECLDQFKLSLNDAKTEIISRPFFTRKSMAIYEADQLIKTHFDSLTEVIITDEYRILTAKEIFRVSSLVKKFTTDLRKACHISNVTYDALSSYILAAVKIRVSDIIDECSREDIPINDSYIDSATIFIEYSLEVAFHLFSLNPTVSASLNLAHLIIRSGDFLKERRPEVFRKLREHIHLWVVQLSTSASFSKVVGRQHVTHVEILNILIALKSYEFDGKFYQEILTRSSGSQKSISYFDVVTKLFIFGGDSKYDSVRKEIFYRAFEYIIEKPVLRECSERTHLLLDLLSCPYVNKVERQKMLRKFIEAFNKAQAESGSGKTISVPTNADLAELVTEFEATPWFTSWDSVSLLRLIEKKKLKEVYP